MKTKLFLAVSLSVVLAACGGGGGGEASTGGNPGTVASTMTFPLSAARQALVTSGMTETYTVSGTCAGTATVSIAAATGGHTFNSVGGRLAGEKTTMLDYSNCTDTTIVETDYYDTGYLRLGSSSATQYREYAAPTALPATVKVGDTAMVGTMNTYTNSTKTVPTGTVSVSYAIEAETATTAIFNVTYKTYNPSGTLTLTQNDRFRISQSGPLKLVSINLQAPSGYIGNWVVQSSTGGNTGAVASTLTFPVGAARKAMVTSGISKAFTVSGTCAGTATFNLAPSTGGATFEGVSGRIAGVATTAVNYSNCTPNPPDSIQTDFYDTDYIRVGSSSSTQYRVYASPAYMPAMVKVGDAATVGTMSTYSNSSKTVSTGKAIVSFNVEADTATTAIYDVITRIYNAANALTLTEHDRYRVSQSGPLELISIDVQYANGSTTHLLMQ